MYCDMEAPVDGGRRTGGVRPAAPALGSAGGRGLEEARDYTGWRASPRGLPVAERLPLWPARGGVDSASPGHAHTTHTTWRIRRMSAPLKLSALLLALAVFALPASAAGRDHDRGHRGHDRHGQYDRGHDRRSAYYDGYRDGRRHDRWDDRRDRRHDRRPDPRIGLARQ